MSSEGNIASPVGSGLAISVRGVSKCYQIYDSPGHRLKQFIMPRIRRMFGLKARSYFREFHALHDVSLEVARGEVVGLVGKNGSGKSTLLQIVCGTLSPTGGQVETYGRVSALLELGSGFNPEFTGRDNAYMNAALLGIPAEELGPRLDDILEFAGIGDFIDQPIKTYSSGMVLRLAFAVAINVDPDILVVDEALAVGDEAFQRKCFSRIEELKRGGCTILFVSHSAGSVIEFCDRAVLLDGGDLIMEGVPKAVVAQYQRLLYAPRKSARRSAIRSWRSDAAVAPRVAWRRPDWAEIAPRMRMPWRSAGTIFPARSGSSPGSCRRVPSSIRAWVQ